MTAGKRFRLNRDDFNVLHRDGFIVLHRDSFIVLGRAGVIVLGRDSLMMIVSFTQVKNKFIKRSLNNLKYLLEKFGKLEIPMTAGKRFFLNRDGFIIHGRDGFIVLGRDGFIVLGRVSLLLIAAFIKITNLLNVQRITSKIFWNKSDSLKEP